MSKEDEIKNIDKQIVMIAIMDTPGTILLGLGLYAKFGTNGDAFHPLLNDPNIVTSMLVLGSAIMAWGGYKMFTLNREKNKLTNTP